nr:hypothetical protein [Parasutterella excrementihominis]
MSLHWELRSQRKFFLLGKTIQENSDSISGRNFHHLRDFICLFFDVRINPQSKNFTVYRDFS